MPLTGRCCHTFHQWHVLPGNDCLNEHVESANLSYVPLNHDSGCVVSVEVRGLDAVEELVAQATMGVQDYPDKIIMPFKVFAFLVLIDFALRLSVGEARVMGKKLDHKDGLKLLRLALGALEPGTAVEDDVALA